MIKPEIFYNTLKNHRFDTFFGVPDSLLKAICAYITDNTNPKQNVITANEGNALGMAAGHFLATNNPAVVYMQNSGLGNIVNPTTSLTDPQAYSIPALLIVGWRGEPGVKDEPQHKKMGEITQQQLELLGIPYSIIHSESQNINETIQKAKEFMRTNNSPYALVIKKNTFEAYKLQNNTNTNFELSREDAVKLVSDHIGNEAIIVSTTGKTSRELFEHRVATNSGHHRDFLTIGCMGHASSIALGIALTKPNKKIYCFDGDGAAIMHMGSFPIIADLAPENFIHIIFNNGAHDSVGGQPTVAHEINFPQIALASGYKTAFKAQDSNQIIKYLNQIKDMKGPVFLEILVNKGARKDLGRPTKTPIENKIAFMQNLQK